MSATTIKIEGLQEATARLRSGNEQLKQWLGDALYRATTLVKNAAQPLAPYKTGTLRRSIHNRVESNVTGIVYQNADEAIYGRRIEYGFQGPDKLGRVYNQKPRPFMAPALENSIPSVKDIFQKLVEKINHYYATGSQS